MRPLSDAFGTICAVTDHLPRELRELVELQCGILTSRQAVGAGVTKDMITARLKYGRWQRIYRGVYATHSGDPGRPGMLWAAVLSAGPGAMLSYQTAAEVSQLAASHKTARLNDAIHITVPIDRRVARTPGIALHRSSRASLAIHPVLLPPQTRIEETILDLASASATIDDACSWITHGLGRRLTTQAKLRQALEQRTKMRWRPELAELLSVDAAGLHSVLERRYYRDVERPHGLPKSTRQERFRRADHNEYRDVIYEAFMTAVELDGQATHTAQTRWSDIRRDNHSATAGVFTLRYGWLDVTARPCEVAAEVARVLAYRGYGGARPCSPDCPVTGLSNPS